MSTQTVKKAVNATGLDVTEIVLNGFNTAMGGLWIGGTATLDETKIAFRPNALNLAVHAGDYSVEIPLADVSDVQVRFGFVTKIIDIVTDHGKLSIPCFGAPRFATKIREWQHFFRDRFATGQGPICFTHFHFLPTTQSKVGLSIQIQTNFKR